jgi:hypothetical protein
MSMTVHRSRVCDFVRIQRGALVLVATAGTAVLAGYALLLHAIQGRTWGVAPTVMWAALSVGVWLAASFPSAWAIERCVASRAHVTPRMVTQLLAILVVGVTAAALFRSAMDGWLPGALWHDDLTTRAIAYAARWSAPALVALVAVTYWLRHDQHREAATQLLQDATQSAEASSHATILIRVGARTEVVALDAIDCVLADGNYVQVRVRGRMLPVRSTLRAMCAELDPARFHRVHRTAVVRREAIRTLVTPRDRGARAQLADGFEVPVSRSALSELRKLLANRAPR